MTNPTNMTEAMMVAQDALLEGRKAAAVNVLLAEGLCLADALAELDGPRLPRVGDILVSSWGYDQTNIDYYEVVGVTKASVKIRAIGKVMAESAHENNSTNDVVAPRVGEYTDDKILTKRFHCSNDERHDRVWPSGYRYPTYSCRISSYSSARLWTYEANRETNCMYGH